MPSSSSYTISLNSSSIGIENASALRASGAGLGPMPLGWLDKALCKDFRLVDALCAGAG